MPKLFKKISKRLAKKRLGKTWYTLQPYATGELVEGGLVHTCRGYNERVVALTPVISDHGLKRGYYVVDVEIETEGENFCSLRHCCTFPMPTKEDILRYFRALLGEKENWAWGEQIQVILKALKNGEDPFEDDGQLKDEYKVGKENE